MIPQITFNYIIYQPNPNTNLLYYWIDGNFSRRCMKIDDFMELVQAKTPTCNKFAYDSCTTYSFYLYSLEEKKIIYLSPVTKKGEAYSDSVPSLLQGKEVKIDTEKKTIEETLLRFGFEPPSKYSNENLKIRLSSLSEKESFSPIQPVRSLLKFPFFRNRKK